MSLNRGICFVTHSLFPTGNFRGSIDCRSAGHRLDEPSPIVDWMTSTTETSRQSFSTKFNGFAMTSLMARRGLFLFSRATSTRCTWRYPQHSHLHRSPLPPCFPESLVKMRTRRQQEKAKWLSNRRLQLLLAMFGCTREPRRSLDPMRERPVSTVQFARLSVGRVVPAFAFLRQLSFGWRRTGSSFNGNERTMMV